ncbi:hypothetical protein T08_12246 [Trichinella sp. T8]|nr:hypothetical protein T08_12246 [Trichinella sp. T8]
MQCSDDSRDAKVMPTTTCYDVSLLFLFAYTQAYFVNEFLKTIFVVKRLCFCISRVIGRPQNVDILLVQFCFSIFGKKKNSRPCAVDHLFARKWVTGSAVMQQNMAIDSGHTGAETVCRNRCQSPQRFSSAGCDMQNPLRDIRRRNSALMGQRSANCVERCSKADWLFAVG